MDKTLHPELNTYRTWVRCEETVCGKTNVLGSLQMQWLQCRRLRHTHLSEVDPVIVVIVEGSLQLPRELGLVHVFVEGLQR